MNRSAKNPALTPIAWIAIALTWPALLTLALTLVGVHGWLRSCPMWLEPAGMSALIALLTVNTVMLLAATRNLVEAGRIRRRVGKLPLLDAETATVLRAALPDLSGVALRVCPFSGPLAFTAGSRAPVIVLSRWLIENLDQNELIAAVAHELAHIRRRDAALLLWLHTLCPSGWGLRPLRQLLGQFHLLIEQRADAASAAQTGRPLALASALAKVGRHRTAMQSGPLVSLTGSHQHSLLRQRIVRLMNGHLPSKTTYLPLSALLACLLIVTLILVAYADAKPCLGWQCDAQAAARLPNTAH